MKHTDTITPSLSLSKQGWLALLVRLLRIPHWIKNLLVFVPLITAHQFTNPTAWLSLLTLFFAFSLCASSVYIINDLLDRAHDRLHPRKRHRPFASGQLAPWVGYLLAPLLLLVSGWLAHFVGMRCQGCLAIYFLCTSCYSLVGKHRVLWDCLMLAMLYTLRILTGVVALQMELSFWLLTCSVFLFLSLAFIKRYAELRALLSAQESTTDADTPPLSKPTLQAAGRGYYVSDIPTLHSLGIASGYISVLVLALYLNSPIIHQLYHTPELLWGMVPTLLFWISWMWIKASRGDMHDDPVVFAAKDPTSIASGITCIGFMLLGMMRWVW